MNKNTFPEISIAHSKSKVLFPDLVMVRSGLVSSTRSLLVVMVINIGLGICAKLPIPASNPIRVVSGEYNNRSSPKFAINSR